MRTLKIFLRNWLVCSYFMKKSYFVSNIKEEVQLRMESGVAGIPAITVGEV